jgi:hypothetical protein
MLIDQTGSRIFYALSAVENKLVFRSDVSNAFSEAPPPKQGFYILPDKAFQAWWVSKGHDPIPDNHVIPVQAASRAILKQDGYGKSTSIKSSAKTFN